MFTFKYENKIDKQCWERIVSAEKMFDHEFPTHFNITQKDKNKARKMVEIFEKAWNEADINFQKGIKKIYGENFPEGICCYINTSPYSMDNYPWYISISMYREDPVATIAHEASHFMFRKCFSKVKDIENIKEIVTVINYDVFGVKDIGWKIHKEQRQEAFKVWKKTNSIKKVIESICN